MSFTPKSYSVRHGNPAPAAKAPRSTDGAKSGAHPTSTSDNGRAQSKNLAPQMPLADQERLKESRLPDELAAELRRLRQAKFARDMRAAIPVASARLPFLRERIDRLEAERLSHLRSGGARAIPAIDEKLGLWRAFLEGYQLVIGDFEAAIPAREREEEEKRAAFRERAARAVATRQAAAERILARREMLAALADDVRSYDRETMELFALQKQMARDGFALEELGVDISLPLAPSAPVQAPFWEQGRAVGAGAALQTPGFVNGEIARGLRIPGIAARGDASPRWLYLPGPGPILA